MDQFLSKKLRRAGTRREQRIVEKYKAIWRIESLGRIGNRAITDDWQQRMTGMLDAKNLVARDFAARLS